MVESAELVEEIFYGKSLITKVLHVDLAGDLVNEVDARCWHSHSADSVHALDLLLNALLRQLLIEGWHAILLRESFLDDASLTE